MGLFDDEIKRRAAEFRPEPRAGVWERIEQELPEKKRRRPLFWLWWLAPLALVGGGYLFFNQNTLPNGGSKGGILQIGPPASPIRNMQHNAKTRLPETRPHPTAPTHPASGTGQPVASTSRANPVMTGNKDKLAEKVYQKAGWKRMGPAAIETQKAGTEKPGEMSEPQAIGFENEANRAWPLPLRECQKLALPVSILSLNSEIIDAGKYQAWQNTGGEKEAAMPPTKGPTPKKGNWAIVAGLGAHNISAHSLGLGAQSADMDYLPPNNNSTGGGLSNNDRQMNEPKPGPGFMLGMERWQVLGTNQRWQWGTGLHYQYQTVKISTGGIKDSTITLESNNYSVASYYQPGSTEETNGFQHRAHLFTGLRLFMGKQRNWGWQNGLYGGVVLASGFLAPLSSQAGWVSSKGLAATGYFGIESGIQYQPRGRVAGGIFGQLNLTSSFPENGVANQYWRGLELRIHYKLLPK